jgi:hypothetical protein
LWGFSPPHFGPPQCYALLYGRAKTSYTAGTSGEMPPEIKNGGIRAAENLTIYGICCMVFNILFDIEVIYEE